MSGSFWKSLAWLAGRCRTRIAKASGSYFGECPRDDEGHCKPSGQGDEGGNKPRGKKPASREGGKGRTPQSGKSPADNRLAALAEQYRTYEEFIDPRVNSPGRRWPKITAAANEKLSEPQDYELQTVSLDSVKPSQSGEDYENESSRELAGTLQQVDDGSLEVGDVRPGDLDPIVVGPDGTIIDGNHRHAAHAINGEKEIVALVPVGKGTGKIRNMQQTFDAMKAR